MASFQPLIRITMFKLPTENFSKAMDLYKTLSKSAVKEGKPYILTLQAGPAENDARNQGFNFVAKSEFKDVKDMEFYDEGCVAHAVLKEGMKGLGVMGFMMVYYTPSVVNVLES